MIVADPSPPPIADMIFGQEVLFIDIPLGAVRGDVLPGAPELGQRKLIVGIDDLHDRVIQQRFADMPLIDPGDLFPIQAGHGAGGLRGA